MLIKIKNDTGIISIDSEVIARTAGVAAMECYGIVGMAARNVRDGLIHLLKMESLTKGVRLQAEEDGLSIDLHVITEYGVNISAVASMLISGVKYKIEESVGLPVREVNVFVEGIRVD